MRGARPSVGDVAGATSVRTRAVAAILNLAGISGAMARAVDVWLVGVILDVDVVLRAALSRGGSCLEGRIVGRGEDLFVTVAIPHVQVIAFDAPVVVLPGDVDPVPADVPATPVIAVRLGNGEQRVGAQLLQTPGAAVLHGDVDDAL